VNTRVALVATSLLFFLSAAPAQPPAAPAATATELFRQARSEIRDGRFDVAAETLKRFLAANPTDADLNEITKADPTAFVRLRNVAKWSDNPTAQAEAEKAVEAVIAKSEQAAKALYQNPDRVAKFVRNLGESPEERVYAVQQLRLAGDAAGPAMVDALRTTSDPALRAGIYAGVSSLGLGQLPPVVAAIDGVAPELKLGLLQALVNRPDVTSLLSSADTDITPHLWYYASATGVELSSLRVFAAEALSRLTGGLAGRLKPADEIVKLTRPYAARQARFRAPDPKLWVWDAARQTVVAVPATPLQVSDYIALRNLHWALQRSPNDTAAQELYLDITTERAVEKAQFGELASANPALYQLLAAAPTDMLIGLLNRAMADRQTARVLGFTQALAARGDRAAVLPSGNTPGVLVRALDYPDARVQLAAAVGLLRVPDLRHGKNARVVDILRRAVATEPTAAGMKETGRVAVADPDDARADALGSHLRALGYRVERFATGRELERRLADAADIDAVFVDRHVVDPLLADLLPPLVKSGIAGSKPVFVVASPDAPKRLPFETILLRLAAYVAAAETSNLEVPAPFFFDPRKPPTDVTVARAETAERRDRVLGDLAELRIARLKRLVSSAGLPQSRVLLYRLDQRLPQLTYAALAAEFPVSPESSPATATYLENRTKNILANPLPPALLGELPTDALAKLLEEFEGALDAPRRQLADRILSRLDPVALGIAPDTPRDPILEDNLGRLTRAAGGGRVVPVAYTPGEVADTLREASDDPARLPASPAGKLRAAQVAVEYLRRIALGEIEGYDVRPAEVDLRVAMKDDALAAAAADVVGHIPTATAQQDLVTLALSVGRPEPIRARAADLAAAHIQRHGKLTGGDLAAALDTTVAAEKNVELRAKLAVVRHLLVGKPGDLGQLMLQSPLPVPAPPAPPAPPAANEAPKDAPKAPTPAAGAAPAPPKP
jgi:hypothetical protein